jgi:hypothetical protein
MKKGGAGLVVGLIILLAGLGIAGAGLQSLVYGPSSPVKCHNEVMSPGESCEVRSGNGSTTRQSYDELKNAKKSIVAPVAGIVFGGLLFIWGGYIAWSVYHPSRK